MWEATRLAGSLPMCLWHTLTRLVFLKALTGHCEQIGLNVQPRPLDPEKVIARWAADHLMRRGGVTDKARRWCAAVCCIGRIPDQPRPDGTRYTGPIGSIKITLGQYDSAAAIIVGDIDRAGTVRLQHGTG